MKRFVRTGSWVILTAACLLCGCNLDFNEAIPCRTDQQCPEGYFCQQDDQRCVTGTAPVDDADLAPDTTGDPEAEEMAEEPTDEPTEMTEEQPVEDTLDTSQSEL